MQMASAPLNIFMALCLIKHSDNQTNLMLKMWKIWISNFMYYSAIRKKYM
jgi:hypothetical protein